jgi:uncharacterized protein YajQ (UPF0234 family)
MQEVENALNNAKKEIATRFDFRGTATEIERDADGALVLRSSDEMHLQAAYKVVMEKLVKRNVSLRALDPQEPEPAAKNSLRQRILFKQGISVEKGKEINKAIKEAKLKVQSQIQDEQVRVTGKSRDELQSAIRLLRSRDFGVDLQFINFRD